jgi:hypothetical protein
LSRLKPRPVVLHLTSVTCIATFDNTRNKGSRAWQTGTEVSDDETVEAAFKTAGGAQPQRALSDAYRRYVQRL